MDIPLPAAALKFPLLHPIIKAVIPGARTKAEVKQIMTWFSTDIPIDFWMELKDKGLLDVRAPTGGV